MKLDIFQKGFNFSQDGPGNRLVYHLQGCNMRCPWCSNPEGLAPPRPDRGTDIRELLDESLRSSMMFFDGGGVTFTGGEATVQFEPLKALLVLLRDNGVNTALETNGCHPRLRELFPLVDFLIIDLKHPSDDVHRAVIGTGNEAVIQNIRLAAREREQMLVRIPLIGGFNDSVECSQNFSYILSNLNKIYVEVLRYHEYGRDKWVKCGMACTMENAHVSDETFKEFCGVLRARGLNLIST
ncbi:MAG: radical SAM protein [Oscillospiraceae bacterium]|nr:radical SAM protein [Oscillospiraceae bacterium]